MTKKPNRARISMMPYQDDENGEPAGYSGPATVLTGLPRTIRRHEPRLIVPLADINIYEMEKRSDFPRHFNLRPRCVVWMSARLSASSARCVFSFLSHAPSRCTSSRRRRCTKSKGRTASFCETSDNTAVADSLPVSGHCG